jgi:hypothetical protein
MFANIKGMSANGLKAMQRAIHDRLIEEDGQPQGQEKIYGVRQYPDWREQADEMEAELDRRGEIYTKVPW